MKKQYQEVDHTPHKENTQVYSNTGRSIIEEDLSSFRELIKSLERANRDLQRENTELKKKEEKAPEGTSKCKNVYKQKLK